MMMMMMLIYRRYCAHLVALGVACDAFLHAFRSSIHATVSPLDGS